MPLNITRTGEVVPVPIALEKAPPNAPPPPVTVPPGTDDVRIEMNTVDARRDDAFREEKISALPIGSTTQTRTLDELALLSPGVAPPPQTIGDVAGPGVGPGVGSAGQFSVNGLRSRANNFTVDGSDNNDEDIGVRRQGFVALSSQPVESVKEFQIITLLAPAQFGRNIGGQVNMVSKAGGSNVHGNLYGYFNSHHLNARNRFDSDDVDGTLPLTSRTGQPVRLNGSPITVRNFAGGEDELSVFQGGGTIGGPIVRSKLFYFFSGEVQHIDATQEKSFAVPSVEQRGVFGTGASGINRDFFNPQIPLQLFPSNIFGSRIFSLIPFANDPNGVFGENNTFTQVLSADGRGVVLSGRLDHAFDIAGREQSLTGRYNFTDDQKDIPAVNEAIFASVRAKTQTHNLSLFLNSRLSRAKSESSLFNQVRLSFGRSRLGFDEIRDTSFLIPSNSFPDIPFLLNAPAIFNITAPTTTPGPVLYTRTPSFDPDGMNVESEFGPLGQVVIAGFSPVGTDVYNFPQTRTHNTYQAADELSWSKQGHNVVVGADLRRTDLNSDLPRLARPLVTFNGGVMARPAGSAPCPEGGNATYCLVRPETMAAFGAANSFLMTFNVDRPDSFASLRYYQLNFYGQDTWRVRPNLSLSYGLRYEYNTPVKDVNGLIEEAFTDNRLAFAPGIERFVEGRTRIFDPDRNNFAPRFGIAFSPNSLNSKNPSVFRAGYGLFYDQILGAVVNQSRSVFPTFFTLNFGVPTGNGQDLTMSHPLYTSYLGGFFNEPGYLNFLRRNINLQGFLTNFVSGIFPNAINATIPQRDLEMPMAHHYTFSFEQQLSRNYSVGVAYVGTSGRKLLRFTTPNGGPAAVIVPTGMEEDFEQTPYAFGSGLNPGRIEPFLGAINRYETTASSTYNSLQSEFRGRFTRGVDFRLSYVLSKVEDDVSDIFDLAGAYALPQDGDDLAAERAPANFDVRHRFSYHLTYDFGNERSGLGWLTKNLVIGATGRFHTGQPFTINSVVDVNQDGNLTDRLNSTAGLEVTGDGSQPLFIAATDRFGMLAPIGSNGSQPRNSFRAGNLLDLNLSVTKGFTFGNQRLNFRADIFNFINHANYGIPVRLLEAPGFGRAYKTVTPGRRIQFSVKYQF